MLLKNYDFEFEGKPEDVGMKTGATIHTMNGLNMKVKKAAEIPKSSGWWESQILKPSVTINQDAHSTHK